MLKRESQGMGELFSNKHMLFITILLSCILLTGPSFALTGTDNNNQSGGANSEAQAGNPASDLPSSEAALAEYSESEPWDTPDPHGDTADVESSDNNSTVEEVNKADKASQGKAGKKKIRRVRISKEAPSEEEAIAEEEAPAFSAASTTDPVNHDNHPSAPTAELPTEVSVEVLANTGAAGTSIPVIVPPGRNGMKPNISLNYNSNVGNGWLGVGWRLGIGAIQRSTKRGADYNADEYVASINGAVSELVYYGDTPGGQREYRAKIEGAFVRYVKYGDDKWLATDKSGTVYQFGGAPGNRQENPDGGIFKWGLSEVRDTNGNYMSITYWKDETYNEIYLDRIDYTGHDQGPAPANSVLFIRDDGSRPDTTQMHTTGFPVNTFYRLEEIEVYGNGQLARKYILTYATSVESRRSLLESVVQYGSDGETPLNETDFQWHETRTTLIMKDFPYGGYRSFVDGSVYPFIVGDFNGDGKIDYGRVCDGVVCGMHTILSQDRDWGTEWVYAGIGPYQDFSPNQEYSDRKTHPMFTGDFNGDGKDDLARVHNGGVRVYVLDEDDTWQLMGNDLADFGASAYVDGEIYPMITGDFNGDGKTDIGRVNSTGVRFYLSDGTGGWTRTSDLPGFGTNNGYINSDTHPIITGDFNGDGKTDVGRVHNIAVRIFHLTENNTWEMTGPDLANFSAAQGYTSNKIHPILTGDFNGDGKTDIGRVHNDGVRVYLSVGDGRWGPVFDLNNFGTNHGYTDNNQYPIMIGDFNGDGKSDIARVSGTDAGGYDGVKVYITENIEGTWNVSWKYYAIADMGAAVMGSPELAISASKSRGITPPVIPTMVIKRPGLIERPAVSREASSF